MRIIVLVAVAGVLFVSTNTLCAQTQSTDSSSQAASPTVSDTADKVKTSAQKAGDNVKDGANAVADKVKSGATEVGEKIKAGATVVGEKVSDTAKAVWREGKEAVATGAQKVHDAASTDTSQK